MKKSFQQRAELRCCASCEWVYKSKDTENGECPKCGFVSYGAWFVFGNKCYQYHKTQKPYIDKKLSTYRSKLISEVKKTTSFKRKPKGLGIFQ